MTQDDVAEFGKLMAGLAQVYGEELSDVRTEMYFGMLLDLPLEAVRDAMLAHGRTSKFFPRPAELRALAPSAVPDTGAAFTELLTAMKRPEAYFGKPPLPAYLDATVAAMGGWRAISLMDREQLSRRFRQEYEPIRLAQVVRSADQPALDERDRSADVQGLIGAIGKPVEPR